MNKKRLSVVMAGAMLASSVAPVLAANTYPEAKTLSGKEKSQATVNDLVVGNNGSLADKYYKITTAEEKTYEVNGSNRGTLVRELRQLLQSKVYSDVSANNFTATNKINLSGSVAVEHDFRGESAYMVYVVNKANGSIATYVDPSETGIKSLEDAINALNENHEVKVINRGFVDYKGNTYKTTQEAVESSVAEKWTRKELKDLSLLSEATLQANYPAINAFKWNEKDETLTVVTRNAKDELECESTPIKPNDDKVDFQKPLNAQGALIDKKSWESDWSDLASFEIVKENATLPKGQMIDAELLASVAITNAVSKEVVKLSDLYDGLFLTTKGQDLLDVLKSEYKAEKVSDGIDENIKSNFVVGNKDLKIGQVSKTIKDAKNGVYTFDIEFEIYDRDSATKDRDDSKLLETKVLTVSSDSKAKLGLFQKWMANRKPQVDVLAGDNRYETAVNVAKENAGIDTVAKNGNIVLVNGDSLVDGLAAAPLAATVKNKKGGELATSNANYVAPILLTESDKLPKSTKAYIRELIGQQEIQHLDKVTVYLVGGEAVISKSLENELRDLGLRVIRAGGDNREETSLKVAEVMVRDGATSKVDTSNAFIVGGEGEADAMSVASVAAREGNPIIVSKKGGLSQDAIDSIIDWKNETSLDKVSATIIGGETAVSKETENALKDKKLQVDRIGGSNRQATNAAVISRYYNTSSVKQIVVSKDGQNRKGDLIDALTATSLAVQHKAPIVLGTKKLSTAQINILEQKSTRTGVYVYQVGIGVARDVVKTIADRVGLAK